MSSLELKPCPFCGADNPVYQYGPDEDGDCWYTVSCEECCVETDGFRSDDEAAEAWNRRSADALIAKLTEALEQMIEHYTSLVNCGDCGNWDPEEEDAVKTARAALSLAKSETPQ